MAVPTPDKSSQTVLNALKKCMADLKTQPKRVYTDWGSEFKGEFATYCVENNIDMKKSCPYRAWQNGLIERCNRSISNLARTLLQPLLGQRQASQTPLQIGRLERHPKQQPLELDRVLGQRADPSCRHV